MKLVKQGDLQHAAQEGQLAVVAGLEVTSIPREKTGSSP